MKIITIGMDLGDKKHEICGLSMNGDVILRQSIPNTRKALREFFSDRGGTTVAIETGTHSPWISRELEALGCQVLVGNARRLRAIWTSVKKTDARDAEMLARIARFDPQLLAPVKHRSEAAQLDLALIKSRDMLTQNRSKLINHARSIAKSMGERVPGCSAESFTRRARENLSKNLFAVLRGLLDSIDVLTENIRKYSREIERLSAEKYPETRRLRQIKGVGPITALAYVLTLEDPQRFKNNRSAGAFIGLVPKKKQSGQIDKELPITKAGNSYLRRLLVGCAHYILGRFGPDCNLRRFGKRIAERGGGCQKAKKRAVVAVARKLSVLLLRLWKTGEAYQPFFSKTEKKVA